MTRALNQVKSPTRCDNYKEKNNGKLIYCCCTNIFMLRTRISCFFKGFQKLIPPFFNFKGRFCNKRQWNVDIIHEYIRFQVIYFCGVWILIREACPSILVPKSHLVHWFLNLYKEKCSAFEAGYVGTPKNENFVNCLYQFDCLHD
jgi:hypothetical protein